jgi:predicted dienelactone hydrolase
MLFTGIKRGFILLLATLLAGVLLVGGYIAVLTVSRTSVQILPAPSGPYAVGRMELGWSDPTRVDTLAKQPNQPRQLAIWIWYPAQVNPDSQTAPYFPPAWAQARNQDQGIGILIERQLSRIKTHSYESARLDDAQAAYPVLIMEPGLGPAIPDYTVLAENLASHGYLVVGINPTFSSNLVVFPDGRVVTRSVKGTLPDNASPTQAQQIGNKLIAVWVNDVVFVINRLEAINATPASPFYQRLDLAHIGVFGHSFGGATSIIVCQQDPRCKAGANLDGSPFGSGKNAPIPVPFLLMSEDYSSEDSSAGCDLNCVEFRQAAKLGQPGATYDLSIKGTRHFNFSDLPVRMVPAVRPLFRAAGYIGSIEPSRGEEIASVYLLAFFDRYLENRDGGLLDGPSPEYPEVQFH